MGKKRTDEPSDEWKKKKKRRDCHRPGIQSSKNISTLDCGRSFQSGRLELETQVETVQKLGLNERLRLTGKQAPARWKQALHLRLQGSWGQPGGSP